MAFGGKPKILSQIKQNESPMGMGDCMLAIPRCLQCLIYQIHWHCFRRFFRFSDLAMWPCSTFRARANAPPLPISQVTFEFINTRTQN